MKASYSILAVAVLAAAGVAPLVAQQASRTSKSASAAQPGQVAAKITKLDKDAGFITLETTTMPGHEGSKTELRYVPSHPAALTMYQEGDDVWARVVTSGTQPRVELLSYSNLDPSDLADVPAGAKEFTVEAMITNIDQNTGDVTIETTKLPGHEGKMTLAYRL